MQPLNLSFRRLLYRKLGKLKPEDVAKFERLTALRHQLSEEKRLSTLPDKDFKTALDKWIADPPFDPDLKAAFNKWLLEPPSDPELKKSLELWLKNPPPNSKLKKELNKWLTITTISDALNNLDKEINKIFSNDRKVLEKLHRSYIKTRKVALKQNLFFQHPFKIYW